MVETVFGATIQIVLQNLLSISMEKISLIRNLREDLEKLKNSFLMIQDFLEDAEMKQVTNKAVKRWLKWLEAVAFDADNILDELNYKIVRKKMKKKVSCFFSNSNSITFRPKMAQKIKDINNKLELINREASSFGLQIGFANAYASIVGSQTPACLETDSFSLDPVFLGRDDDVSRIVEMLTIYPAEQVFSVLPIVGMGGLGKTTVARKVFGNEKIKTHFENLIWVYVSKNFDVMILLKNIIASLTTESVEFGSREILLKKLQRDLGAKRYLLVLDDLWNVDSEMWDSLINSLAGISSVKGNDIIVTTRSETVASIVRSLDIHLLKGLSNDDCWSIIKAKAFGEGSIPTEFETMGKNVAKRCQGLPLAAKVVGGLLRGKSNDEWLSIEEKWLGGDENIVSKILKLSFDHLSSSPLKKCFAYCSIFPKGARIHKEKLIELWMAEGFLETYQSNDMETAGNNFFNLLLQNSLLQVVEKDSCGNITHCNTHNLVHDLASSVLCLRVNEDSLDDNYKIRYSIRDASTPFRKEQAKYLRTLIFEGKIFDTMFSHFKCLHVLTLMGNDVTELPSSISKLIHLRCLDISYTRITCLPDSIGKLYHLQTLRALRKCEWEMNYLLKLPSTFKYLISLRHLHIPNIELPPEVGRLTSRQTLPYFQVSDDKGRGIVELGSLRISKEK